MPLRKRERPRKDNSAGSSSRTIPRNQRGSVTNGNRALSPGRKDKSFHSFFRKISRGRLRSFITNGSTRGYGDKRNFEAFLTQAFEWHRGFRETRESVEGGKLSGRPQTSRNAEYIEKVSAAVRENMLQTLEESVRISSATCQWILTKHLNIHRACKHIVPRMLKEDQSADEVKSASQVELKDMAKNGFQKYFDDLCVLLLKCLISKEDVFQQFNW
ncbi:hypothetical protein TNCV_809211 [Trichonephila clavipes]|nr:hypothetical protein TNCV_809211 [Trichonephila clavipes]